MHLRPSSLGRLALCPGSAILSDGLDPTSSPEATEGTRLHAAVAQALIGGADPALSEDDLEIVKKCEEFLGLLCQDDTWQLDLEGEHVLDHGDGEIRGTPDVVAFCPTARLVRVVDWKFYRTPLPEAFATAQMQCYGLMAWQKYRDQVDPPIECWCYVPYGDWKYKLKIHDPDTALKNVRDLVSRATEIPLRLDPGEVQCKYCPASAGRCWAVHAVARMRVPAESQDLSPVPTSILEDAYDRIKALDAAADRVKRELLLRAESGESSRYQAVKRRGRQRVEDPRDAVMRLEIAPRDMLQTMTVSVPKLRDLYQEIHGNGRSKKDTAREFEERLGPALSRAPSYHVLQRKRGG